jgi:hypothetical protein
MKKWKHVVFSDKSKFNLFESVGSDGLQWCRRGLGEEFKAWNLDGLGVHHFTWVWKVSSGRGEDEPLPVC